MELQETHLISFSCTACTANCEASDTSNQIKNSKDLTSEIVDDFLLKISKLDMEDQKSITFQCHSIESNSDKNPVVQVAKLVIYNIKKLDTVNKLVKLYQIKNEKFDVQINENQ